MALVDPTSLKTEISYDGVDRYSSNPLFMHTYSQATMDMSLGKRQEAAGGGTFSGKSYAPPSSMTGIWESMFRGKKRRGAVMPPVI